MLACFSKPADVEYQKWKALLDVVDPFCGRSPFYWALRCRIFAHSHVFQTALPCTTHGTCTPLSDTAAQALAGLQCSSPVILERGWHLKGRKQFGDTCIDRFPGRSIRSCACLGCRDDLVNLMIEAVQNPAYSGVYNGTAPNPVRMSEFCSSLGAAQVLGLVGFGSLSLL